MARGDFIQTKFPVLFHVKMFHHYFLDVGKTLFHNLSDFDKLKVLAGYDVRRIIEIKPTKNTQRILTGHQMLFKPHGQGFSVLCKSDSSGQVNSGNKPSVGLNLRFSVKIVDPYFMQYSAGFLQSQTVRVEKSTDGRQPDRFFKKLYLLRNDAAGQTSSLASEPANFDGNLTYPPEAIVQHDADNDGTPEYFISQMALAQNTVPSTIANTNWLKLAQVAPQNSNVNYVTQADLTEIELEDDIPAETFALIEIDANSGGNPVHLYDGAGDLKSPTFEVRFKNRLTWWQHKLPPWVEGPLTAITHTEILPLSLHGRQVIDLTFQVSDGNNGTKQLEKKAAEVPSKRTTVLPEIANDGSVTRLLSDIYI